MKKAILSLLLICSVLVFAGCGQKKFVNGVYEKTTTDRNGNKVITKTFQNGMVITELYETNKITRTYKTPDGNKSVSVEETSVDENGNQVITRTSDNGSVETEIREKNKTIRIEQMPGGGARKTVEENVDENTKVTTTSDDSGVLNKRVEKNLGGGKRSLVTVNNTPEGVMKIEEYYQELDNNEQKNVMIVTYPDGKVEKRYERFFRDENGKAKIERTNPDGSKVVEDL